MLMCSVGHGTEMESAGKGMTREAFWLIWFPVILAAMVIVVLYLLAV